MDGTYAITLCPVDPRFALAHGQRLSRLGLSIVRIAQGFGAFIIVSILFWGYCACRFRRFLL